MTAADDAGLKRYLVLTLRTPRFDPGVIAPHYAHLDRLRERGRLELAGPFGDKSGGAYIVRAHDLDEATAIAFDDPVHTTGASQVTVYEWHAK
ncbi:YciI family protein [Lysobacter fragariae]